MFQLSRVCWMGALAMVLGSATATPGQLVKKPSGEKDVASQSNANRFLRMQKSASGEPISLQTAITSYKPRSGLGSLQVDLVGAVHVGDKPYYQSLNKKFREYDVVLYELVAPKGTRVPQGGRKGKSGNPISMLQGMTKDMLELSSQMDEIDYTRGNFVHADMSPAEMQASMESRGETPMTVALDAFSEMMKQAKRRENQALADNVPPQKFAVDPIALLFDSQRSSKLKVMMAEQFSTMGADSMGGAVNRLLIEDRNAAAMKVFQKEVAKGHRRIAIFYGAAHLPDFEKRLIGEFDLSRGKTEWLTAWDLRPSEKPREVDPVNELFRSLLQPTAD